MGPGLGEFWGETTAGAGLGRTGPTQTVPDPPRGPAERRRRLFAPFLVRRPPAADSRQRRSPGRAAAPRKTSGRSSSPSTASATSRLGASRRAEPRRGRARGGCRSQRGASFAAQHPLSRCSREQTAAGFGGVSEPGRGVPRADPPNGDVETRAISAAAGVARTPPSTAARPEGRGGPRGARARPPPRPRSRRAIPRCSPRQSTRAPASVVGHGHASPTASGTRLTGPERSATAARQFEWKTARAVADAV